MASSYNELFGLGSHSEDASLVAWWPQQDDAANTTIDDISAANNDATLTGAGNTSGSTTTGPGKWLPKALTYDGVNDHGTIASPPVSAYGFTILGWFRSGISGLWASMLSVGNSGATNMYVSVGFTTGNKVRYNPQYSGTNAIIDTSATYNNDAWHHVAAWSSSQSSHGMALNNGTPQTNTTDIGGFPTMNQAALSCLWRTGKGSFFPGEEADWCMFSRVLTSGERTEVYSGPEPVNTVAPAMTGTETVGETLSTTSGTWALDSPFAASSNGTITYAYQWTRSDDAGGTGEADISGATSSAYTLVGADSGKFIRCRVAASNDGGNDSAADTNSNMSGAIAAAAAAARTRTLLGVGI